MRAGVASIDTGRISRSKPGTQGCQHAQGPKGLSKVQASIRRRRFTMSSKLKDTPRSESAAIVATGAAFFMIDTLAIAEARRSFQPTAVVGAA